MEEKSIVTEQVTETPAAPAVETAPAIETPAAPAVETAPEVKAEALAAPAVETAPAIETPAAKKEKFDAIKFVEFFAHTTASDSEDEERRYLETRKELAKYFDVLYMNSRHLDSIGCCTSEKNIEIKAEYFSMEDSEYATHVMTSIRFYHVKAPKERKDKKLYALRTLVPGNAIVKTSEQKVDEEDAKMYIVTYPDKSELVATVYTRRNGDKLEFRVDFTISDDVAEVEVKEVKVEATAEEAAAVKAETTTVEAAPATPETEAAETTPSVEEKPAEEVTDALEVEVIDEPKKVTFAESFQKISDNFVGSSEREEFEFIDDDEAPHGFENFMEDSKRHKVAYKAENELRKKKALKVLKISGIVVASVAVVAGISYIIYKFVIKKG